ncbi:MAG: potassium channel protein [Planctomycetota bacterium]|nr:MAG: potassium channel protein [Planctomycetota bacterium]
MAERVHDDRSNSAPPVASNGPPQVDALDAWLVPIMFYAAVVFLGLIAAIMVLWVDIPRVVEMAEVIEVPAAGGTSSDDMGLLAPHLTPEERRLEERAFALGWKVLYVLIALWAMFILEQVYRWVRSRLDPRFAGRTTHGWVYCLFPPLRLGAHRHGDVEWIWLPVLGWQVVDRHLRRKLERIFSIPMFWIALMILPVLGLQFYFKHRIIDHPILRSILHVGTGVIWFAFAMEFIVMISVAKSKLRYCKEHWLDLAIIVLPLVSFLRSVRVLQAMRFVPATQLQQLSKAARVYRMRGVVMRAVRAMMLLELAERVLRTSPHKRLERLEQLRREKLIELEDLDAEIAAVRAKLAAEAEGETAG